MQRLGLFKADEPLAGKDDRLIPTAIPQSPTSRFLTPHSNLRYLGARDGSSADERERSPGVNVLRKAYESKLPGLLEGDKDSFGGSQKVQAAPAVMPGSDLPAMDDPLAVMNALHQVFANMNLHADLGLPQIAVVGSQSVGKTSVLESLVGRDFLPRGSGIVTRRPLVLQLRSTESGRKPPINAVTGKRPGPDTSEWAEFAHKVEEPILDFEQVKREIQLETERTCGDNSGISDEPILLRIFSPNVIDLTLVDLPGLTKVPTGDQPTDIADRIRSLVLRYVSHESCLILAVSAANTDLATSDALALAREVDPEGRRTLGVLTKLDLADDFGSALEALQGRVYPLRLGYIGVVCRSESASIRGVSFENALKSEEDFLQKSRTFRHVADQCGVPHLAKRLHELLLQHIMEALPELRARINEAAEDLRKELAVFGNLEVPDNNAQGTFMLDIISGYARNFADALEGRLAYSVQEALPDRLMFGARLHYIFHRCFAQAILDFETFTGLSDLEIRAAMRNAAGPKPQLFVPEVAFETLVKRQIKKLEDPSLQCVHLVYEELKHIVSQSEVPEMQRFPGLREKASEVAHGVIRSCLQPTNQMVVNLIKIELAQINVDHPDFIGGLKAMSTVQLNNQDPQSAPRSDQQKEQPRQSLAQFLSEAERADSSSKGVSGLTGSSAPRASVAGVNWKRSASTDGRDSLRLPAVPAIVKPSFEVSEKERMDIELLKSLITSYFAIVKRKIIDAVPKTIMHFMVNHVRDSLHHACIAELYQSEQMDSLLREGEEVRQKRQKCQEQLAELRRCQDMLAKIRDNSRMMTAW